MDPERYRHLTYDVTMAAAKTLARLNPGMVFTYVTGKGTDSTEQGSLRWARVKGKTENDLLKLPFKAAYMFRPSGIQPLHGVRSKTGWINVIYALTAPLLSWMVRAVPTVVMYQPCSIAASHPSISIATVRPSRSSSCGSSPVQNTIRPSRSVLTSISAT